MEQKIIRTILSSNLFIGNSKVLNLEEVVSVEYSVENIQAVTAILKTGNYEKLTLLEPPNDLLGEELKVVRFMNEKNKVYYGLYYESFDLLGKAEVLELVAECGS